MKAKDFKVIITPIIKNKTTSSIKSWYRKIIRRIRRRKRSIVISFFLFLVYNIKVWKY